MLILNGLNINTPCPKFTKNSHFFSESLIFLTNLPAKQPWIHK
jgi:hypothetical protein